MKEETLKKTEELRELYVALEKAFPWEQSLSRHFVALIYAQGKKPLEVAAIKEMSDTIKKTTGLFSIYRGNFRFMLAALLVQQYTDPKDQFRLMMRNDTYLREAGFKSSSYLPIANYALLASSKHAVFDQDIKDAAKKAYDVYTNMKKNHPWLTSGDDYPLAVLLSQFENPIEKVEEYYQTLYRYGFYKGGSLQMLSHILSFSNEPVEEVVRRCSNFHKTLKDHKLNIYAEYYSALGLVSLIKDDSGELVADIIAFAKQLQETKKYRWLGKGMNVLLASALVTSLWIQKAQEKDPSDSLIQTALSVSIETIIAAQTAAMVAAISASTAAAASAST